MVILTILTWRELLTTDSTVGSVRLLKMNE